MPFFLATASPGLGGSALTTCGLVGAFGATNAVLPESIISGRRNRPRIASKACRGLSQYYGRLPVSLVSAKRQSFGL